MCRLFAFRSHSPLDVRAELLDRRSSLKVLSVDHCDGWGIATWDATQGPRVVRGVAAAHADPAFERAASTGPADLLFAHVRQASVGSVLIENVHPFARGRWVFMHNGTLTDFAVHQAALERHIDADLFATIGSTTDSERCFLLFLSALRARAGRLDKVGVADAAWALGSVMRLVERHTDVAGRERSSMNFLVSDGRLLLATRRGRSLYVSDGQATGSFPACGTPLPRVAIASVPADDPHLWCEVAEDDVFGVDADLTLHRWRLPELAGI